MSAKLPGPGKTPEQFRRLKQLYEELHSLPQEEWEAFVAGACGDDLELRRELAALIAHYDRDTRLEELGRAVEAAQSALGQAATAADVEPTLLRCEKRSAGVERLAGCDRATGIARRHGPQLLQQLSIEAAPVAAATLAGGPHS